MFVKDGVSQARLDAIACAILHEQPAATPFLTAQEDATMPASVPGIHHVTAITADVQRNVDFYVGALGLRFIKKTVNFDVPDTYHLYFADYLGTPGTAMTFFGWPHLPWGFQGRGQVVAVSFRSRSPPSTSGSGDCGSFGSS